MRADLLGGESAALVADGERDRVKGLVESHAHRRIGFGKLEGILQKFIRDFVQIFLGNGQGNVRQFKGQIRQTVGMGRLCSRRGS